MAVRKIPLFAKLKKSRPNSHKSGSIEEKFDVVGTNLIIYKGGFKVKMKTNQWHTAYGLQSVSILSKQKVYKWRLKITRQITTPKMCVGISSTNNDGNTAFHQNYDRYFYGFCTKSGSKISSFNRNNEYYTTPCKHHDIITMEFNIYKKTIKYYRNNQDLGIAFNDIDLQQKSYCLAIAIFGKDSKVELVEFSTDNVSGTSEQNNEENKQNAIEENINYNKEISLKEMNEKLEKENDKFCDNIDLQNGTLQKRKADIKQQQKEINNLKTIISKLTNDNKEMEKEHLELKQQINIVRLQALEKISYKKWNTLQVIYWIVHLNYNNYKQYEDMLTNILIEEEIDGSCLNDIELDDIKLWNIQSIEHQKYIFNKIKSLINGDKSAYIDETYVAEEKQCESKQTELIGLTDMNTNMKDMNNSSLDSIDNIQNNVMDVPIQHVHYDSLDIMQHQYLLQEINEKEDKITPQ